MDEAASNLAPPPLPPRPRSTGAVEDIKTVIRSTAQKGKQYYADGPAQTMKQRVADAEALKQRLMELELEDITKAVQSTAAIGKLNYIDGPAQSFKQRWAVAELQRDAFLKDMNDTGRSFTKKESLCEHCSSLPVSSCWDDQPGPGPERLEWSTPLERIMKNSSWCQFCRLLLDMLSRSEFDPLSDPRVADRVPTAIKGLSMAELKQKSWSFINKNWPFGRTNKPGNNATYMFDGMKAAIIDELTDPANLFLGLQVVTQNVGKKKSASKPKDSGSKTGPKKSDDDNSDMGNIMATAVSFGGYSERRKQTLYRRECTIRISICTSRSTKLPPGLLLVSCLAHLNRYEDSLQLLKKFRMRVEHPEIPSRLEDGDKVLNYGKRLDPNWIDLKLSKMWLWECETKHGDDCCQQGWDIARRAPRVLRVIDVQKRCVVSIANPSACRYVALSYMWGGVKGLAFSYKNSEVLMQEGSLERLATEIPRTILDAMEVVEEMQERYLWVDTLCKLQEEDEHAKRETAEMDCVYGGALATIIAASGTDANAGLRGVNRKTVVPEWGLERTISQQHADVNRARVIAPFYSGQNLEETSWNGRGWTFQERLLSRRLIAFSGNEMVWYCRNMTCREDMRDGDAGETVQRPKFLNLKAKWFANENAEDTLWVDGSIEIDRHRRTHLARSGRFTEYAQVVDQYTRRQLTYKSDVIFAFEGLANIFERSFQTEMLYGLPKCLFDVALLWRPTDPLKRRLCDDGQIFPSWSWSGWEGRVRYEQPLVITRDYDGDITNYERGSRGEEGIRPISRWHIWNPETSQAELLNRNGRGIPLTTESWPKEWEGNSFDDMGISPGIGVVTTQSHHLFLTTYAAKALTIGPAIVEEEGYQRPQIYGHVGSCQLFQLLDVNLHVIGSITLDSDDGTCLENLDYEFVVLAECHRLGLNGFIAEFADYVVMLVARLQGVDTYERLGLGSVSKEAWALANPSVKTIILG